MASIRVEPDRDHSQKSPSNRNVASAAADQKSTLTFDGDLFNPSLWNPIPSVYFNSSQTPGIRAQQHENNSSNTHGLNAYTGSQSLLKELPHLAQQEIPRLAINNPSPIDLVNVPVINAAEMSSKVIPPDTTSSMNVTRPHQCNNHGFQLLRAGGFLPPATSSTDSGLLTPNTTPSTGGHRWTPPSALDSTSSGSSGSLPQMRPRMSSSPTDGFTPSTYATQSPWNGSIVKSQAHPLEHQVSPCPDQAVRSNNSFTGSNAGFSTQTERQLFKSNDSLYINLDDQQAATPSRSLGFRPMDALLPTSHHQQTPSIKFPFDTPFNPFQPRDLPSFSSRYCGKHVDSNASADHLLPEQNCALWLTNLPPTITYTQLLASIRHCGRIWCTYINEPNHREHVTAAAKVVFFSPRAATAYFNMSRADIPGYSAFRINPFVIQGYQVNVAHNRIKYPEKPCAQGESRVLIVTGHPRFVNGSSLYAFFHKRFIFQIDRVRELVQTVNRAVVEFSFGSYRCQAQMGVMALEKDRPAGFEKVEYGEDPCEVGETYSSYKIAMERVQGIGL